MENLEQSYGDVQFRQTLGVLFLHHNVNEVVLANLKNIRDHNPHATMVTMSAGEKIAGGYSIEATPGLKAIHGQSIRRSSDWLVCSWFQQRKEQCDKWWIVEWDTFCRSSVQEYYRPVWKFPYVASTTLYRYRNPDWSWFKFASKLPEPLRPFAMGASPFIYLVSESALQAVCTKLLASPSSAGNGELRFATAANSCGYAPCAYSPPNDCITWMKWKQLDEKALIIHPVKEIFPQSLEEGKTH